MRTPACRRFRTTASLHAGKHSSNGATAEPSRELLAAEKFGWALVPPPVSILKGSLWSHARLMPFDFCALLRGVVSGCLCTDQHTEA